MNVGKVCTRQVATCTAESTVLEVAELMRSWHVGDLVVVEIRNGDPVPIGIVTDRDLVLEVMVKRIDPAAITAGAVMSRKLVTAYEGEELDVAMDRMRWSGIRRIPLVDSAGALVGIATLDDIAEVLALTLLNVSRVGRLQHMDEENLRT